MNRIERWLAPGILCGVALLQIGLANFGTLSPWKGGGFGMFGSVDSLGMRVVSCEGVATTGETIRINPFAGLNPGMVDGWRAMPRTSTLHRLGQQLLGMRFVPAGSRQDAATERFLTENPQLRGEFDSSADSKQRSYRPLLPIDPPAAEGEYLELTTIRLRWWRIEFDSAESRFAAAPIGELVELSRLP